MNVLRKPLRFCALVAACVPFVHRPDPVHAEGPPASAPSQMDAILLDLQNDGKDLQDFSADVKLANTDEVSGDSTAESGTVVYKNDPAGARIRVAFDKKTSGNTTRAEDRSFLLADGWLTERDITTKKQIRRQVLHPGEKTDLLKLGEGPFPLPIGQSPAEVLRLFDVKQIPLTPDDPAGSFHLQLVPKPGTRLARKFSTIDVFVDPKTHWPARIATEDPNHTTQITTDLSNLRTNTGIKTADVTLPPPKIKLDEEEEPLQD